MKRILSVLMSVVMMVSISSGLGLTAYANDLSGTCGGNLTWYYEESSKTLKISGFGVMYDYSNSKSNQSPWNSVKEKIKSVRISGSATTIGNYAFYGSTDLKSVILPKSVIEIGEFAFDNCDNLKNVYYSGSKTDLKNIVIGEENESLTSSTIHYNSTGNCTSHTYKKTTVKATMSKNGCIEEKCTLCGNVKSKTTIYMPKTFLLSTTIYTYNGKVKKPSVTVKDSKKNNIESSNYTVTYASGRKNVGKYSVKIKFKGNYSGTKTLYFTIKPKATKISSLKADNKSFTVKYGKVDSQCSGYQVQYSTSSNFKSPTTKTLSSNKTTSYKKTNLKANKKYYVRVRTYKQVGDTKFYSDWSSNKSVTTNKSTTTQNSNANSDNSSNTQTVYKTPTGKRYHYSKSCAGKNAKKVSVKEAKKFGLTPCKKCS